MFHMTQLISHVTWITVLRVILKSSGDPAEEGTMTFRASTMGVVEGMTSGKESTCQCRRPGFNPWVKKIPGEGSDNPLQYSCLGNPMDRGAWWATVHRLVKSLAQLSSHTHTNTCSFLSLLSCLLEQCFLGFNVSTG